MAESDLVVVGGGPAGLAVAIRARLAGLTVVLLEGARPPVDRPCGEGLMPDALRELQAMGVAPDPEWTAPFRGIRYIDGEESAEGRFPEGEGLGVRRTALHEALARRAAELGADLRWGVKATGLRSEGVNTESGSVAARFIVGADGRNSSVRRWAGLEEDPVRTERNAVRRHFTVRPWTDLVEVYWAPGCEAYVTPVGAGRVGVALLWTGGSGRFDELLGRFPALAKLLSGAPAESKDRGVSHLGAGARAAVRQNVALVGDAGGGVDPITGVGVTLALLQARSLVEAVAARDLLRYETEHRRLLRGPRFMSALLLWLSRHPRIRRGAVRALAEDPDLFGRLAAFHVGGLGLSGLGTASLLRLAARSLSGARRHGVPARAA